MTRRRWSSSHVKCLESPLFLQYFTVHPLQRSRSNIYEGKLTGTCIPDCFESQIILRGESLFHIMDLAMGQTDYDFLKNKIRHMFLSINPNAELYLK